MIKLKATIKHSTDDSYNIFIQKNASDYLLTYLKRSRLGDKYAIIVDNITEKLIGKSFAKKLKRAGLNCELFSFKSGEINKGLQTVESLAEKMMEKQFTRKDVIIALGGGIVGDIAGFLASIFQRAIPYIQIPTTLLAMVDSCIGGKTGVDLKAGKNLIGTFYQPKAIFIDTEYLKTLPEKMLRSGLAEIIKYGIIADQKLFKFIEQNHHKIFGLDEKAIDYIIKRSIEIKVGIMEKDVKENGLRMLLNYGHTYGHALEKLSNYTLLHGYAISIGMVIINDIAIKKKILKKTDAERIKKLFKKCGLPVTTIRKPTIKDILSDKKREGDYMNFVMPTKIGHARIYKEKIL